MCVELIINLKRSLMVNSTTMDVNKTLNFNITFEIIYISTVALKEAINFHLIFLISNTFFTTVEI